MDTVRQIDLDTWARRTHFEHYRREVPCSHAMTVDVDVTELVAALRVSSRKTYVAQIWALAALVNRHPEFRLTLTSAGDPAVWGVVHPMFTVFNPERETFAAVWVPFDVDFGRFHDRAARALAHHRSATTMFPQGSPPANCFDVSSIPWSSFSAFNLQIDGASEHFQPIFTLGRYIERAGRTFLPLAVQVHHAAADAFHSARLIDEFRELAADPAWID